MSQDTEFSEMVDGGFSPHSISPYTPETSDLSGPKFRVEVGTDDVREPVL